eukprot:408850_1
MSKLRLLLQNSKLRQYSLYGLSAIGTYYVATESFYALSTLSSDVLDRSSNEDNTRSTDKRGPVAFRSIAGKWIGECQGEYPTIQPFKYGEQIEIIDTNKPFLSYSSSTWKQGDQSKLMHSESGFIRFPYGNEVDFVISQCSGVNEISSGDIVITDKTQNDATETDDVDNTVQNFKVVLGSSQIGRVALATEPYVTKIQRVYTYDCETDMLAYEIWMATTNTKELTKHLSGSFKRAV